MIRKGTIDDLRSICNIYNYYVRNSIATFEVFQVSIEEMQKRFRATIQSYPWLVSEADGDITGYAYASYWKNRHAYRYTLESSIYLAHKAFDQGWGSKLYQSLIAELKSCSIHNIIGGIALPNDGSIALHEKFGLKKVAHFKEVGRKFDQWIDVGYWELVLDKSKK